MRITNLNSADEIGASAWLLEFAGYRLLLDAGVDPKREGRAALPLLDLAGDEGLDAIAISHCHHDHVGALPVALRHWPTAHVLMTELTKLQRPISAYLRENLHYTVSGFNFLPPFLDLLLEVGVERIMFSADYPFQSMSEARDFLDRLPVSPADRERIAHGNAEVLMEM